MYGFVHLRGYCNWISTGSIVGTFDAGWQPATGHTVDIPVTGVTRTINFKDSSGTNWDTATNRSVGIPSGYAYIDPFTRRLYASANNGGGSGAIGYENGKILVNGIRYLATT